MPFFWLQFFPPFHDSDTPPSLPLRMWFELSGSTHTTRWSTWVLPVPSHPVAAKVLPLSFDTVVLVSPQYMTLSSFGSMMIRP